MCLVCRWLSRLQTLAGTVTSRSKGLCLDARSSSQCGAASKARQSQLLAKHGICASYSLASTLPQCDLRHALITPVITCWCPPSLDLHCQLNHVHMYSTSS